MAKNNIRSIRFSDELAELIDRQIGNSFTEKFENLITKCVWELPQKEKELKQLEEEINEKREELFKLRNKTWKLSNSLNTINHKVKLLEASINEAISNIK